MEEDVEKSLTIRILGDEEISELDWETRGELPGWNEEGKDVYCNRKIYLDKDGGPFKGYSRTEGEWVSIARIRKLLNDFESKGATHIAMEHHCDHQGYMFDYGCLSVSSQEEVIEAELRDKEAEEECTENEIKALQERLDKLRQKKIGPPTRLKSE